MQSDRAPMAVLEEESMATIDEKIQVPKPISVLKYKITIGVLLIIIGLLMAYGIWFKYVRYQRKVKVRPTLKIPIHYIWIGTNPMPPKFADRLKNADYPYKLLGDKEYAQFKDFYNFSENISIGKRSDAFRLIYLWKYGGIYADLDYEIDYYCLMSRLQGLNGTFYSMEQDWHRKPVSSLMYASAPGDPILQEFTGMLNKRQSENTLQFVLAYMQRAYDLTSIDLDDCAYHEYAGSWGAGDPNPF